MHRRREALLALLAAAAAPGSAAAQSGAEADAAPRILEFRDRIKAAVTAREEQVVVQAFGPTTAAATGVSAIKDGAGKPIRFRWLTVYVKDALGDWRVAVSQASRAGRR